LFKFKSFFSSSFGFALKSIISHKGKLCDVFQLQRDFHPGEMSEQNRNSSIIRTRIEDSLKPEESQRKRR
jgi:hypothetical protein